MMRSNGFVARRPAAWLGLVALVGIAFLLPAGAARAQDESGGYMGVVLQDLDRELRDSYDFRGSGGVLVSQVESGSPARAAGLREGDIITRINGTAVSTSSALSRSVRSRKPGDTVTLGVWRDGRDLTLQLKLGDRGEAAPDLQRDKRQDGEDRDDEDMPAPPAVPGMPDMPDMRHLRVWSMDARPRLGVELEDLDHNQGGYYGRQGRGVMITRVLDGSAAERAGLREGDLVIELGGVAVDDAAALRRELARKEAGPVTITVLRKGERRTFTADLGPRSGLDDESRRTIVRRMQPWTRSQIRTVRPEDTAELRDLRREVQELREEVRQLRAQLRERDNP